MIEHIVMERRLSEGGDHPTLVDDYFDVRFPSSSLFYSSLPSHHFSSLFHIPDVLTFNPVQSSNLKTAGALSQSLDIDRVDRVHFHFPSSPIHIL